MSDQRTLSLAEFLTIGRAVIEGDTHYKTAGRRLSIYADVDAAIEGTPPKQPTSLNDLIEMVGCNDRKSMTKVRHVWEDYMRACYHLGIMRPGCGWAKQEHSAPLGAWRAARVA